MSTNFGSDNGTTEDRWYLLPEIVLPETYTKIAVASAEDVWYIIFYRRTGGADTSGLIALGTNTVLPTPGVTDGPLGDATALWKGYLSWYAVLDVALSDQELMNLANSTYVLLSEYSNNVSYLWDFSEANLTIPALYGEGDAIRFGVGYGINGPDPLPYKFVRPSTKNIPDFFGKGVFAVSKANLSAGAGATVSISSMAYAILGKSYATPAITNAPLPTIDANTHDTFEILRPGERALFVFGYNSDGKLLAMQSLPKRRGAIIEFPDIPGDVCPIGYEMVQAKNSEWLMGVSAQDQAFTEFVDVLTLPGRPDMMGPIR